MPSVLPGFPAENEYSAFTWRYLQRVTQFSDPIGALEAQGAEFIALLAQFPAEKRLSCYAPGKWSVQQLLGHVTDAERVFVNRALYAARKDPGPLPGFEEDDWAAASGVEACPWETVVREFEQVRAATISFFRNLPPDAWTRTIVANSTTISVRALAYLCLGHLSHHMAILRERYL